MFKLKYLSSTFISFWNWRTYSCYNNTSFGQLWLKNQNITLFGVNGRIIWPFFLTSFVQTFTQLFNMLHLC